MLCKNPSFRMLNNFLVTFCFRVIIDLFRIFKSLNVILLYSIRKGANLPVWKLNTIKLITKPVIVDQKP